MGTAMHVVLFGELGAFRDIHGAVIFVIAIPAAAVLGPFYIFFVILWWEKKP